MKFSVDESMAVACLKLELAEGDVLAALERVFTAAKDKSVEPAAVIMAFDGRTTSLTWAYARLAGELGKVAKAFILAPHTDEFHPHLVVEFIGHTVPAAP